MQQGVFGGLSVHVTKAVIPPRGGAVAYELSISNAVSKVQCTATKTDADFRAFRHSVRAALELGHLCDAECPWLYFRIEETKPSRSLIFWDKANPRRVQANLTKYQAMMNMILEFLRLPKNQCCSRLKTLVPQALVAFLFADMEDDVVTLFAASPLSTIRLSPSQFKFVVAHCSICTDCMDPEDPASSALTTLPCGHTFHDDCILDTLQHHLVCPTCDTKLMESVVDGP
ncbi:Aste57867_2632 [Aphanomyces stellatus]|uniref:Aste57867_2632 protein n=1 Tax=Aphanomyces stellatus TaxID=120398 RepID=A0A485K9M3_9STRA|nr:hypothetical protein As57867_002625 [Aphanomyces stellatus]VFT79828.1 Aste57867_2632 [Aphanomyces stellatus]